MPPSSDSHLAFVSCRWRSEVFFISFGSTPKEVAFEAGWVYTIQTLQLCSFWKSGITCKDYFKPRRNVSYLCLLNLRAWIWIIYILSVILWFILTYSFVCESLILLSSKTTLHFLIQILELPTIGKLIFHTQCSNWLTVDWQKSQYIRDSIFSQ